MKMIWKLNKVKFDIFIGISHLKRNFTVQKNDESFMLWEHDLKILSMLLKIVFSVQTHLATLMNPCNYRLVLKVSDLQRHTGVDGWILVNEFWAINRLHLRNAFDSLYALFTRYTMTAVIHNWIERCYCKG